MEDMSKINQCSTKGIIRPCLEPLDRKISSPRSGISVKLQQAVEHELKYGHKIDSNMDPKKLRRMISNRLSAQKSRSKKAQYINYMEKKVKDLQATIAFLSPQIARHKHHQTMLRMENGVLEQKLDTWTNISNLRKVQIEEKKAEVKRLRELQTGRQQEPKKQEEAFLPDWDPELEQIMSLSFYQSAPPPLREWT